MDGRCLRAIAIVCWYPAWAAERRMVFNKPRREGRGRKGSYEARGRKRADLQVQDLPLPPLSKGPLDARGSRELRHDRPDAPHMVAVVTKTKDRVVGGHKAEVLRVAAQGKA